MNRNYLYSHSQYFLFWIYFFILSIFSMYYVFMIPLAFSRLGIHPFLAMTLFWLSLLGSFINIPVAKLKNKVPMVRDSFVNFWGIKYRVPYVKYAHTTLAINVGGAMVPVLVSSLIVWQLITRHFFVLLLKSLIGISITTLIAFIFAKPVKGVGIALPAFLPPIVAALMGIFLGISSPLQQAPVIIAYLSGTLGTLIGADLLHLKDIENLGAPVASIGGAGTFDGIFLSGIIAVLLV